MNDLKTVTALVKQILEDEIDARTIDNEIYMEVLRYYSTDNGMYMTRRMFSQFLMKL